MATGSSAENKATSRFGGNGSGERSDGSDMLLSGLNKRGIAAAGADCRHTDERAQVFGRTAHVHSASARSGRSGPAREGSVDQVV